jgi:hypothetical protein
LTAVVLRRFRTVFGAGTLLALIKF